MSDFGLAHIKTEGGPIHPDDISYGGDNYDAWYASQLKAYNDYHGIKNESERGE